MKKLLLASLILFLFSLSLLTLQIACNEKVRAEVAQYVLPAATLKALGGVIVGKGLDVAKDGTLSVIPPPPPPPPPTPAPAPTPTPAPVPPPNPNPPPPPTPTPTPYTLLAATASTLGGVIVGSGIDVSAEGRISTIPYTLPAATTSTLGGVIAGSGIGIAADGRISTTPYTLPAATTSTTGGIIVGDGLTMGSNGKLSVTTPVNPKGEDKIIYLREYLDDNGVPIPNRDNEIWSFDLTTRVNKKLDVTIDRGLHILGELTVTADKSLIFFVAWKEVRNGYSRKRMTTLCYCLPDGSRAATLFGDLLGNDNIRTPIAF